MYTIDSDGDIVISGFQNGIGASPYSGLTDLKSVNISSIPGEASVSFSTSSVTKTNAVSNGTFATDVNGNLHYQANGSFLENGQAFYVTSSSISGLSAGTTPYYVSNSSNQGGGVELLSVVKVYGGNSLLTLGTTGTATFSTFNLALPKYSAKSRAFNFMIDSLGQAWSDMVVTSGGTGITPTSSWTYMGNYLTNSGTSPDTTANGNGILCFQTVHDGTGGTGTSGGVDEWIFIWRNSAIDYTKITDNGVATSPIVTWVYGWKPSAGTSGNSNYLQNLSTVNSPHQAIVTPDSRVNYCDANYIGNFYQNIPTPGNNYVGFDPTNTATYTFANITAVLPALEIAQCIGFVNQYLLIGTKSNIIYNWDLNPAHNTYSTPLIQLPETNTKAIITIGNNAYIFAGNRGQIYITNGSQASPYKKMPDHISGTVEPLFYWGGSFTAGTGQAGGIPTETGTFNKKRLYFGCEVVSQSTQSLISGYGGVWVIDTDTGSLYNSNQLSYGSYAGAASVILSPNIGKDGTNTYGSNIGYGYIAGWTDGSTGRGIDVSVTAPYTGTQSYVVSDAIPVGTFLKPVTPLQVEFKLASPLLSGETVVIQVASDLPTILSGGTTALTTQGDGALVSGNSQSFPVEKQQWLFVKAILESKTSSPSYNRLTELRVIGATVASPAMTRYGVQ